MIYLFLLALFFVANMSLLGALIIDGFDLRNKGIHYASPIGMVVYFGLLQILYYPIQYFEAPSTYIHLSTCGLSLVIFVVSCIRWKVVLNYFIDVWKNKKEVLLCLILFSVFCFLYTNVEFMLRTEDSNFYISYVASNVYTSTVGLDTSVLYKYQGIYNFYSTFVYLYHRLASLPFYVHLLPIGIISWGPSIIFFWVFPFFLANMSSLILRWFNMQQNIFLRLTTISVCTFTMLLYWYLVHPYYGNTFRRITVVYLMLALYEYYKHQNWKDASLVSIILFSFISQTSTGFFLGVMLIYALIILFSFEKRHHVMMQFGLIGLPLAMYLVPLIPVSAVLVAGIYGIIVVGKTLRIDLTFEKIVHVLGKILLVVLPICFFIFPKMNLYSPNPQFSSIFREHSFDQVFGYLRFDQGILITILNLISWISLFVFLIQTFKKEHTFHYFGGTIGIILLTFFNPWVTQFVSDKMTDLVYFRIYDLIFNPLTHLLFLSVLFNSLKSVKQSIIAMTLASTSFLIAGVDYASTTFPGYLNANVNMYYHTNEEGIDVLNTLREKMYIDDPNRTVVVASHIYGTELLADYKIKNVVNNRVDNIEALYLKTDDESVFQQIFYRKLYDDPRYETDYMRACELARKKGVEYTIVESKYNYQMEDGLGYCGEVMFEENGYRVYIMRYDWLDILQVERDED